MKSRITPSIFRNVQDSSITLTHAQHTNTLIWLHGLGDTSEGFLSFFTHSHSPLYHHTKIKLIQAPLRRVTINLGQVCNSWYDIKSLDRFTKKDEDVFNLDEVEESVDILQSHVREEADEYYKQDPNSLISPYHKIFVGGFSQGGVIGLKYAMERSNIPAGVICLSGYMLKSTKYRNINKVNRLLIHGENDSVIEQQAAKNSYKELLKNQNLTEYKKIDKLDHSVCLEELSDMGKWLEEVNFMIKQIYKKNQV